MDSLEDFKNLSINIDLDDGTNLNQHWNTDLRRRLPDGPHSHITPFVRDRTAAQALASVNRFSRNQLSCGADCPPNHICYPKGEERCVLGDERPGKEHCCEFNNSLPAPPPDQFLRTIVSMTAYADQHPHARSYRDPGFYRGFKRLFAPVLQQNLGANSSIFFTLNLDIPDFQLFPNTRVNAEQRRQLVLFGARMFHSLMFHFVEDVSIIRDINESFRNNSNFYWDFSLMAVGNSAPLDFLCTARNLNLTAVNTSHTEQDVFDMIVQKLNDTNDRFTTSNILVQIDFQQAGGADFSAITRACLRSSFKGRILCSIHPQTQVTEGMFGSIGIYVKDDTPMFELVVTTSFFTAGTTLNRVLIIESH